MGDFMARIGSFLMTLTTILALSSNTEAHRIQHPKRDSLAFSPGHLALSMTLDVEGGAEASALRERYDRNGDGAMDQEESEALQGYLVKEVQRTLRLTVNGKALDLTPTSVSGYGLDFPKTSREHLGILAVLEGPIPAAPVLAVSVADTTTEGMRQVPVEVWLKGFTARDLGPRVVSEDDGHTLKTVLPQDGTPWTFSLAAGQLGSTPRVPKR
jgi:hypothetical protein